jgi:hypothetical protein
VQKLSYCVFIFGILYCTLCLTINKLLLFPYFLVIYNLLIGCCTLFASKQEYWCLYWLFQWSHDIKPFVVAVSKTSVFMLRFNFPWFTSRSNVNIMKRQHIIMGPLLLQSFCTSVFTYRITIYCCLFTCFLHLFISVL